MKGKQAVAKGDEAAIADLVESLNRGGIAAEICDSGSVQSAWVDHDRADEARTLVNSDASVRLVSRMQSAYELCSNCGYDHGAGATHCRRCGHYVRA